MNSKISKTLVSGLAATAVMSLVMYLAPMMGLPEMNAAAMLAGMMGMPLVAGWIMHFMIGVIFAGAYVYLFSPRVKITKSALKGAVFGLVVFVFAQVVMAIMGALMGGMPKPQGSMMLMMIGSILGHVVYGMVVALLSKE